MSEWNRYRLGELGETYTGLSGKTKDDFGSGKPFIPYKNIFYNTAINPDWLDFVQVSEGERQYRVQYGDIFFTTSSETPDEVGMSSVLLDDLGECYLNSFCFGFRPHDFGILLPQYARYLFRGGDFRRQMYALSQGSTRFNLSKRELLKSELILPPLPEQRKIAEILSTWDEAIALTEQLIAALERRKKGLMQRLLTGQVRFPEFEGSEWRTYRLGDLLREVSRHVPWDDEATYHLISVRRRSEGIVFREAKRGAEIRTKNMKVAREGDFLISKMQVVHGAAALTTEEFDGMHISGSYIALVSRDRSVLNIEYFDWLSKMPFMYHLAYLSSSGVHIEKMTFSLDDYLRRRITIPADVEEQERIVAVLSASDREISILRGKTALLKKQKKGLMQRLLTGQVRVKV